MPERGYGLTEGAVRKLRGLVRDLTNRAGLKPPEGRVAVPTTPRQPQETAWVKILSTTKTDGRYPGLFSWYDSNAAAWNDGLTEQWLFSGDTSEGSAAVTNCSTTSGFTAGDAVTGDGIPDGATVASVDSATQITLSDAATATATGVVLVEAQSPPGGGVETHFEGDTTNGSAAVSNILDTSVLAVGDAVTGTGIPANAVVVSVDSDTQVTLSANATATNTGVSLTATHGLWVIVPNGETLSAGVYYLARACADVDGTGQMVYEVARAVADGGTASPLTTKGDVWGYDTADARIPVGADGDVLTADSTQALGVKWATPSGGASAGLGALVTMSADQSINLSSDTWLRWDTVITDDSTFHFYDMSTSARNTSAGEGLIAPADGYYIVSLKLCVIGSLTASMSVSLVTSGTSASTDKGFATTTLLHATPFLTVTGFCKLTAGQYVRARLNYVGTGSFTANHNSTSFAMAQLRL